MSFFILNIQNCATFSKLLQIELAFNESFNEEAFSMCSLRRENSFDSFCRFFLLCYSLEIRGRFDKIKKSVIGEIVHYIENGFVNRFQRKIVKFSYKVNKIISFQVKKKVKERMKCFFLLDL